MWYCYLLVQVYLYHKLLHYHQFFDVNEEVCDTNILEQEDNNTTSIINDKEIANIVTEEKETTEDKVEKLNIEENQTVEEKKSPEV
jgi:hypothetical protein